MTGHPDRGQPLARLAIIAQWGVALSGLVMIVATALPWWRISNGQITDEANGFRSGNYATTSQLLAIGMLAFGVGLFVAARRHTVHRWWMNGIGLFGVVTLIASIDRYEQLDSTFHRPPFDSLVVIGSLRYGLIVAAIASGVAVIFAFVALITAHRK